MALTGPRGAGKSALAAFVAEYPGARAEILPVALSFKRTTPACRRRKTWASEVRRRPRAAAAKPRSEFRPSRRYVDARGLFDVVVVVRPTRPASLEELEAALASAKKRADADADARCLLVLDNAERCDPADARRFLASALDGDARLCALSASRVKLDRPKPHEIRLAPLDSAAAARLFARQCPRLHTSNDRRKFCALVTRDVTRAGASRSPVLAALDTGLPGAVVAAAFRASRDDLADVLRIARERGGAGGSVDVLPDLSGVTP